MSKYCERCGQEGKSTSKVVKRMKDSFSGVVFKLVFRECCHLVWADSTQRSSNHKSYTRARKVPVFSNDPNRGEYYS